MKIKQWTLLLLTCCLTFSWGCASKQMDQPEVTLPPQKAHDNPENNGIIGGTLSGTGKVISSTFNAADSLVRGTISLIPFVDIRKAQDASAPEQSQSFRNDFPIAASDLLRSGLKVHWASHLDIPKQERISQWAVLEGGYLITIEVPSNLFTVINLRDGSIVWRQIHGQYTDHFYTPFRYGEIICVNSETHMLKIDLKTGRALEIVALKAVVNNSPAHVNNFAIFGGLNGRIFAHDINTGFPKWNYQMQAGITAQPVATQAAVFIGDSSGVYILLSAIDGTPAWKGRTVRQISAPGTISLEHNIVFIPSEDQTLYALNQVFGNDLWRYHAKRALTHQPIIIDQQILLPITGNGLVALDITTGKPLWQTNELLKPFDSDEDYIYCHKVNSLWVLAKDSGKTVSQIPTAELLDIIGLNNGQFLIITKTGRLLKLQR